MCRRRLTGRVTRFGPHSHGVQVELARGIKQTTYAKTNRRVRFEMKYRRSCFPRLIGSRTRLSREALSTALQSLRRHALREFGRIFEEIDVETEMSPETPTSDDLLLCVGRFCERLEYSEEIIRSLRDNGNVVVENGSVLRPSIDNLREARVLRFLRHTVYTVTDEFEPALQELMSQSGAAFSHESRMN